MGTVYCAEDTQLRRQVALKLLNPDLDEDPQHHQRFLREARLAAALHHASIATIYEVGEDQGLPYIAIELIQGQSLRALLTHGALPLHLALDLATQIALGLAHAHEAGVLHRDLKPENIMVTPEHKAKILDFGLAKSMSQPLLEVSPSGQAVTLDTTLSREGFLVGTPGYMSPEQVHGQDLDQRSDVFAFGIILYEMLTGLTCFVGNTPMDILIAISRDPPTPALQLNPEVPQSLQDLLDKCLVKDPRARCADMANLAIALHDVATQLASGAATPHDKAKLGTQAPAPILASDWDDIHDQPTKLNPRAAPLSTQKIIAPAPSGRGRRRQVLFASLSLLLLAGLGIFLFVKPKAQVETVAGDLHQRGPVLRIATFGVNGPLAVYPKFIYGTSFFAATNIFDRLLRTSSSGLQPNVIDHWQVSKDYRSVNLYLRPGLRFHPHPCFAKEDSRIATLDDLVYSLYLPAKVGFALPPIQGVEDYAQGRAPTISGVSIVDDHVQVRFGRPCAFCLDAIADLLLVPKAIDGCSDPKKMKQLVGTGPFRMNQPKVRETLELAANDAWSMAPSSTAPQPRSQALRIMRIADPDLAIGALTRGEIDAYRLDNRSAKKYFAKNKRGDVEVDPKLAKAGIKLAVNNSKDGMLVTFVSIPPKADGPLEDPALRQILALALDRQALCQDRLITASGSLLTPNMIGYLGQDQGQQSDPAQARILLQQYLKTHAPLPTLRLGGDESMAPLIGQQLRDVGFSVDTSVVNVARAQKSELDLIAYGWGGPILPGDDPSLFVYYMMSQAQPTFLPVATRQRAKDLLYLLDGEKRERLMQELQQALLQDARMIFYGHPDQRYAMNLWLVRQELQGWIDPITGQSIEMQNFAQVFRAGTDKLGDLDSSSDEVK